MLGNASGLPKSVPPGERLSNVSFVINNSLPAKSSYLKDTKRPIAPGVPCKSTKEVVDKLGRRYSPSINEIGNKSSASTKNEIGSSKTSNS